MSSIRAKIRIAEQQVITSSNGASPTVEPDTYFVLINSVLSGNPSIAAGSDDIFKKIFNNTGGSITVDVTNLHNSSSDQISISNQGEVSLLSVFDEDTETTEWWAIQLLNASKV